MNIESPQSMNFIGKLKNALSKIFTGKHAKRNIAVIVLFLVAFGGVYYKYFWPKTPTTYEYATATKKDIKKTVEGSGKVVSVSELDIQQLQNGGKVTAVYVKPGDYVKRGQIIATLDNRQAGIQLTQAKASYDKIVNGSTKEELDITKQGVINAKQNYDIVKQQQDTAVANAKRTLLNTSITAIPVYDTRLQANSPIISGSYTCTEDVEYNIKVNQTTYADVSGIGQVIISSVPQALGNCGLFISFDSTKDYSNGEWKVTLPNKISSSYSTNLNAYNNALQNRDIALINASTSVVNAELSLNQKVVGARAEDIKSAEASLANAQLNYENTIIRAPFDGQIGAVSAAVGQQTNSQAGVATIITKDKIAEISLNEIDIVNVKLGQEVELSFDAIPEEVFVGTVAEINTVGIATSNVVSFSVKISIPDADERIKSGMSVTANIITDKKIGVLSVPSATIKIEGKEPSEKSYVLKKEGTKNTKSYITVGLTNDIDTEVIDGLSENDQVVSKTIAGTVVAKTTTAFSLFGAGRGGTGGGVRPTNR